MPESNKKPWKRYIVFIVVPFLIAIFFWPGLYIYSQQKIGKVTLQIRTNRITGNSQRLNHTTLEWWTPSLEPHDKSYEWEEWDVLPDFALEKLDAQVYIDGSSHGSSAHFMFFNRNQRWRIRVNSFWLLEDDGVKRYYEVSSKYKIIEPNKTQYFDIRPFHTIQKWRVGNREFNPKNAYHRGVNWDFEEVLGDVIPLTDQELTDILDEVEKLRLQKESGQTQN